MTISTHRFTSKEYPFLTPMMNWRLFKVQFWLISYHASLGVEMQRVMPFRVANTPTLIALLLRVHFGVD